MSDEIDDGRANNSGRLSWSPRAGLREYLFAKYPADEYPTLEREWELWEREVEASMIAEQNGGDTVAMRNAIIELVESSGGSTTLVVNDGDLVVVTGSGALEIGEQTITSNGNEFTTMDIAELSADELADILAGVDAERLIKMMQPLVADHPEITMVEGLWRVFDESGVPLAEMFGHMRAHGVERAEVEAAVAEAWD